MRATALTAMLLMTTISTSIADDTKSEQTELIPLEVLFGNPSRAQARIAPDGAHLSWLAPSEDGVLNVWVQPSDRSKAPQQITSDKARGIRQRVLQDEEEDEEKSRVTFGSDSVDREAAINRNKRASSKQHRSAAGMSPNPSPTKSVVKQKYVVFVSLFPFVYVLFTSQELLRVVSLNFLDASRAFPTGIVW